MRREKSIKLGQKYIYRASYRNPGERNEYTFAESKIEGRPSSIEVDRLRGPLGFDFEDRHPGPLDDDAARGCNAAVSAGASKVYAATGGGG